MRRGPPERSLGIWGACGGGTALVEVVGEGASVAEARSGEEEVGVA